MFDMDSIRKEKDLDEEQTVSDEEKNYAREEWPEEEYQAEKEFRPNQKNVSKIKILTIVVGVLAVLLAAAAMLCNATFVIAGGFHRRDAKNLDLREKNISLKNYEKLSAELPGCEILWNVPMGKDCFDCQSESLTLATLTPEEYSLFAHFPQLKMLDVTAVALSVEDYRTLSATLPNCYIRWSIPIGDSRYDSAAREIAVSNFTGEEVELFTLFDGLTMVDATACRSYDEILSLQALLPETKVLWNVELNGTLLHQDTATLTLDGAVTDYAALNDYLRRLPALQQVTVDNCTLTTEEQINLLTTYPHVSFHWPVELLGKTYDSSISELNFANAGLTAGDLQTITEVLPSFYALEMLDLSGCGFTNQQVLPLYNIKPELVIYWEFELYGQTFSTTAEEIDLSNITIEDLSPLEATIARMPHLKKVIMCDCGLSNEKMDELCQMYEDIRFVWTVQIGPYSVRTDATGFIGTSDMFVDLTDEDCAPLKYCTDLLALDLGHKSITHLEFVRYMPNLKYLIISRSLVKSFEPVSELKNLVQLEAFLVPAGDLEYLLECPNLLDLNICYIGADKDTPHVLDILSQMTQLERLWYGDNLMTDANEISLRNALPGCICHEIYRRDHVFTDGWREHKRYYEMRDLLGMFYMNGKGIQVQYKVLDGVWYWPGDEGY